MFAYQVVRVWQLRAADILAGGLGTLPLAMLCDDAAANPEAVVEQLRERLDPLPNRALAAELWTATDVLMGLRYDEAVTARVLRGVRNMKESVTYQAILREGLEQGVSQGINRGRLAKARESLIAVATELFGPPDVGTLQVIDTINDHQRLTRLIARVVHVDSWSELLQGATG